MMKEQKIAEIKEIVRDYLESKFYFYMFINLSTGDIWSKEFISENDYIVYHDSLIAEIKEIVRDYLESKFYFYRFINLSTADIWSKEFISENDSLIEKINLRDYLELAVKEYNMTNDEIADNMSNAIYKDYFERD